MLLWNFTLHGNHSEAKPRSLLEFYYFLWIFYYQKLMSEDHWRDINSHLHFIDESEDKNENDPLYKIRPLIDHIIRKSQKLYSPKQGLTIDESMIKFRGRSRFKVYMPLKPIKYGFKAYVLSEASTDYMLNWSLHEGNKNTLISIIDGLVHPYKNRNHLISMDRFYTTYNVIKYLHQNGFRVYGAITKNRGKKNWI